MRSRRGDGALGVVLIAIAILGEGPAARAGELFVMPYSCTIVGGRAVLTPSDDKGYSIIGHREQREFKACSSVNPSLCRQWTLYRFDLDCGGTRVPWVSVAPAASRSRGRSWVEHNRLHVEMPPRWAMAIDDPCAVDPGSYNRSMSADQARYCADRRALARAPVIEMPDGFAPLMGLDAIFVADAKSNTENLKNAAKTATARTARPSSPQNVARHESTKSPGVAASSQASKLPDLKHDPKPDGTTVTAEAGQQAGIQADPAATINGPGKPPTSVAPSETPTGAAAPQLPSVVQASIPSAAVPQDNQVKPSEAKQLSETPNAVSSQQAQSSNADKKNPGKSDVVTGSVSAPGTSAHHPDDNQVSARDDGGLPAAFAIRAFDIRSPAAVATMLLVGLGTLGLLSLAGVRRERMRNSLLASRDIGNVSFEQTSGGFDIIASRALIPATPRGIAEPEGNTPPQPAWTDHVPETIDDALRVLGMGIGPDVSGAAVKKIIDGLRLSWHPDRATSDDDRALREFRMKQINAAWDILARRPSSSEPLTGA